MVAILSGNFKTRKALILSDTHWGSSFSAFPPEYKEYRSNDIGREIWECFEKFKQDAGDFDTIIHLADMMEGTQRLQFGSGTYSPDLNFQFELAEYAMKPLIENKVYMQFRGSGYHKSMDFDTEKAFAHRFAEKTKQFHYCGQLSNFKLKGSNIQFYLHHGGGINWENQGGRLSKKLRNYAAREALYNLPKADVIINAHFHNYVYLEEHGRIAIQLPSWKAFEPSKITEKNPENFVSNAVGGILITTEGDYIDVKKLVYPISTWGLLEI